MISTSELDLVYQPVGGAVFCSGKRGAYLDPIFMVLILKTSQIVLSAATLFLLTLVLCRSNIAALTSRSGSISIFDL